MESVPKEVLFTWSLSPNVSTAVALSAPSSMLDWWAADLLLLLKVLQLRSNIAIL